MWGEIRWKGSHFRYFRIKYIQKAVWTYTKYTEYIAISHREATTNVTLSTYARLLRPRGSQELRHVLLLRGR